MAINQVGKNEIKDKAISFEKLDTNIQIKVNSIGSGTLNTTNKTIIPAINELKSNETTLINSIGTLSGLKTTAKGSTVAAINELFQSGVDLQNIAKSALNAAGIGYINDQLNTLVNTMGSNLYTQDMKNRLANAIVNAGGSANANDFNSIINGIGNIGSNGRIVSGSMTCACNNEVFSGSRAGFGKIYTNSDMSAVNIDIGFTPTVLFFNYDAPYSYTSDTGTKYSIKNFYYLQVVFPSGFPVSGISILLDSDKRTIVQQPTENSNIINPGINFGVAFISSISAKLHPYTSEIGNLTVNWFAVK